MAVAWPTAILPLPTQNFTGQGTPNINATQFASGRVRTRLVDESDRQNVSLEWEFNDEQYRNFQGFWIHKLDRGSQDVTINMPWGDGLRATTFKFTGPYSYSMRDGLNWTVSAPVHVDSPPHMNSTEADSIFGA